MREGQGRRRTRPIPTVVVDEDAQPIDWLRDISTWSVATLAVIGVGCSLYLMRELLIPVVTAFVVGVMFSPLAGKLETKGVPRILSAALIVLLTALLIALVAALIAAPVTEIMGRLPELRGKLEALNGVMGLWRRLEISIGLNPTASTTEPALPTPNIAWLPTTIGLISPPITGFLYFLVVLLLFISWWPDFRRQLVMTFAGRDARLTTLKILNETEAALAAYLLTVASINVGVGVAAGVVAFFTGLPFPIGFGALATTLNFIPIIGPILMIGVFAVVGVITGATLALGFLPAGLFMLAVFLEGQFITPAIIGRRIEINSLAVLLSLMFWTWMWGPMGAFLSSPILIVALILRGHLAAEP